MTIQETANKKYSIITDAEKSLIDGLKSSEKAIFNKVLAILQKLAQKEGKLTKETINNKFLNT